MAWTTPLGDDLELVWDRLLGGETGLAAVPYTGRLRNGLAAAVPSVPPDLPPGERLHRMACRTIKEAIATAGADAGDRGTRLILGTSLGAYLEDAPARASLYTWAEAVGREVGAATAPIAVSTACSSGSDAILLGAELIRAGAARRCVCGGVDVLTWSKRIAHSALGTMSPSFLRAFDVRHDGTLLGEGAAFVVLEAAPTDREPLAILRGCGAANDATGMTAADVSGQAARYAIERSLADAGLEAGAIELVNAHGSGTPMNDATEGNAVRAVFDGNARPLVFATKGNFGHSLGATGAMEAIALVMAMRTRRVPPVVGLEQPDPDFPLPLAYAGAKSCNARRGLSLTLGFGGFDTSLVFEVPQ